MNRAALIDQIQPATETFEKLLTLLQARLKRAIELNT
jgi:hypothetical protein